MKHTKGPWVLKKNFLNDEYLDINTEIGNVGSVNTVQAFLRGNLASEFKVSGVTEEMCKANANLIAAAPEMLEALEAVIKSNNAAMKNHETANKIIFAIKKARGEV